MNTKKTKRGYAFGERQGSAKLTNKKVLTIRKLYESGRYSMRKLAKRYNVSAMTIHAVISRENWSHL